MAIRPEALAAQLLRDYLLLGLPSKVAAINSARAPALKAPMVGPYLVPVGAKMLLRSGAVSMPVVLTSGSRTATQVAVDFAAAGFAGATSDYHGRLVLTGNAPSSGATRLELASEAEAGSVAGLHGAFGFDAGGNRVVCTPLVTPTWRGIYDGFPVQADFPGGGVVSVIIGDRRSAPQPNVRRDMHDVELELHVLRAEPQAAVHSTREGIQAALQAVRELVHESRTLDESETSDRHVMLTEELAAEVNGRPYLMDNLPNLYFDNAQLRLRVRIYERS